MYATSLCPFAKLNLKTAMLVPMLMLSMFTFLPLVHSQVMPNISKMTPAVFEQMSSAGESINVIIQTLSNDYSAVISQINGFGGTIGHLFKYVNALSASVPKSQLVELSANSHIEKIYYDAPRESTVERGVGVDLMRGVPEVAEADGVEAIELTPEMLGSMGPENAWNSYAMGARPIWTTTNYGAGSLVAVIDTGIWTPNIFFRYTSIVGGVDLSADVGTTYEGWNRSSNYFHGGHVAGIIAANIALAISPASALYRYVLAVERYAHVTFPVVGGRKIMPVPGMAPLASLYIIKVFTHTGGATSSSYIMAGMEWAIQLKEDGIDVDIVNMSLGGPDLFDGRDPEDQLVDLMTQNEITVCASAGNNGPATMTAGASPGGANTAIASGAADHPVETRAFWDYYYNSPGIGYYLYVSNNIQIDSLTSRGPTADGRVKPDVTATGVFVFSAYHVSVGGVAWASGTSMASPATAGAVALLNAWAEMNSVPASPEDYKQAIKGGAVWLAGWTQYDQGAGYLNAANSLTVLMNDSSYGDMADPLPSPPPPLTDISNIPIVGSGTYTTTISGLAPGWNKEFIFKALPTTNSIRVTITGVSLGSDPLGGANSLTVHIESAKRTMNGYYVHYSYVVGNAWYLVTDGTTRWKGAIIGGAGDFDEYTRLTKIEPGYVKVVIENDWISYDLASATIEIKVTEEPLPTPDLYLSSTINDGQYIGWLSVPIIGTPTKATLELWWDHSWSMFPTNDLDLIVYWDDGYNYDGATLNSPERVVLDNPTFIYVLLSGYTVYTGTDNFTLKIYYEY